MQHEHTKHGACVIRREGKRGVVFKIKYRDASGRQVKETLGREQDGWTGQKANAALDERLVDVRRDGLTKSIHSFAEVANEWIATYPKTKELKTSTIDGYKSIVEGHLIPAFGHLKIGDLDVHHLDRYVASMIESGYSPGTVNRHLNVVYAVVKAARRRRLVRENVVDLVERPPEPRLRWEILSPAELARVETAFRELAADLHHDHVDVDPEHVWLEQARVVFLTVVGLGLRRGEVLGLRWRNVFLADPAGPKIRISETIVRGKADTPKSAASERTLALGPRLASELFDHRAKSMYVGDDELVFCHPDKGTVFDHKRYAKTLEAALKKAKIKRKIRPFHDYRHTAITHEAAAGNAPAAIQARAGHADFSTTQRYIHLAGVVFRDEAERAEARIFGDVWVPELGTNSPE
jgi:integrase